MGSLGGTWKHQGSFDRDFLGTGVFDALIVSQRLQLRAQLCSGLRTHALLRVGPLCDRRTLVLTRACAQRARHPLGVSARSGQANYDMQRSHESLAIGYCQKPNWLWPFTHCQRTAEMCMQRCTSRLITHVSRCSEPPDSRAVVGVPS